MGNQKYSKHRHSQLKQELRRLSEEIVEITASYLPDKPLIKGTVYELKRKCGKPRCKCTQGQLHHQMVVSSSEKGKTKIRTIPVGFLTEVKEKVRRYQKLRRARARLIEVQKKMFQIMDEIEVMRREEVPTKK